MDLGLKKKVAIVFAASKGLGKGAALALAVEGCKVAICSSNTENIKQAASEIRAKSSADIFAETVDVGSKKQIETFIKYVADKWGTIDILVNNAGGPPVASFEESNDEEWQKWYNITFMSVQRSVKAALPYLKKDNWGRIINITSVSVKAPVEKLIYSNALRLAVIGLAKSLSIELGPYGITVNNVAPGYHLTDGLERIIIKKVEAGAKREDVLNDWTSNVPVRRIGQPEDLANMITFLASDKSGYISGTTIPVEGGNYRGVF